MHHSFVTPVIDGDTIYGCDSRSGALMAVRLSDGERLWQTIVPTAGENAGGQRGRGPGNATAFLVKHDKKYFLMSETGDLIIAELSPDGYTEIDRAHILDPLAKNGGRNVVWSHPAFAQKSVFARNDQELVRVSLER
jgi:outer membrane protein assembly factor BamB